MAEPPEISENRDLCTVCQEVLEGRHWTRITPCSHPFHTTCITAWFQVVKKRTCPSCRKTALPPDHASTVKPLQAINGNEWEVDQQGVWQRLEVHDKQEEEAAQEVRRKQIEDAAAQLAREHVDETVELCIICHQPLGLQYWVRLHDCRHTLHSSCAVRCFLQQRLNKSCPECRARVRPPSGPVPGVENDLLITINNHESQVEEWAMWHVLNAVEKNQDEKQMQWKLRKIRQAREDKARQSRLQRHWYSWPIFESSEQKKSEELARAEREEEEQCYLCDHPLGRAFWARLRSSECEHPFHTGCIVHHFFNEGNPRSDCPICYTKVTPPPLPPGFDASSIKTIHDYSKEVPELVIRYLVRYQLNRYQEVGDAALEEAAGGETRGHLASDEMSSNCAICRVVLGSRFWATLPSCGHSFHTSCLAAWIFFGGVMLCPECGGTVRPPTNPPRLTTAAVITPIKDTHKGLVSHAIWVALAFVMEGADIEDIAVEALVGREVMDRARAVRGHAVRPRGDLQTTLAEPSSVQDPETAAVSQTPAEDTLDDASELLRDPPQALLDGIETPQAALDATEAPQVLFGSPSRVRLRADNMERSPFPSKKMKEKAVVRHSQG